MSYSISPNPNQSFVNLSTGEVTFVFKTPDISYNLNFISPLNLKYLVVGGGGAGAANAGGGGGGGMVLDSSINQYSSYTFIVGNGGTSNSNGNPSIIYSNSTQVVTSYGGSNGNSEGLGGTSGNGYSGGIFGGGGGGQGGVGLSGASTDDDPFTGNGGNAENGIFITFNQYYSGTFGSGGGGGGYGGGTQNNGGTSQNGGTGGAGGVTTGSGFPGLSGNANTGGGGGGGGGANSGQSGGSGGSGIIVISFFTEPYPCFLKGSKILTDKGYKRIEDLRKGHLVKTLKHEFKAIDSIGFKEIYHDASSFRLKNQLYKYSKRDFPELTEDLILTGCHSILVKDFSSDEEKEQAIKVNGNIYITENRYRLPACVDKRAHVYAIPGKYTIYHIALENEDIYMNYGIMANGLLVESCSIRTLKELSEMKLIN